MGANRRRERQKESDGGGGARAPGEGHAPVPEAAGLQRTLGNRGVQRLLARRPGGGPTAGVQRRAEVPAAYDAPPEAIHEAARAGVQTASTAFPHADRIQRAFGAHEVSGLRAHQGPAAAEAAAAMGASAYTSGDHVVFAGTPDLRTAAHEAAHAVQQQAGVQLPSGVGREGDAYERHADAVADRVVAGRSAEDLLGSLP